MAYERIASAMEGLWFLKWAQPHLLAVDPDSASKRTRGDEICERFGPIFRDEAEDLEERDFDAFLDFEHNHHWTGLQRQKKSLLSDMTAVRKAIATLTRRPQYGADNVDARFDQAAKQAKGFTEAIITPILLVSFPEDYGVWNSKSTFALELLRLSFKGEERESKGNQYVKLNNALLQARNFLNRSVEHPDDEVTLWSIDYYWHVLKQLETQGKLDEMIRQFREEGGLPQ